MRGREFFAMHKNLYSSEIQYYLHNLFYKPITDFDRSNLKLPHNQKWIKTVPINIDEFMSLTTLAYLICGDGTFTGYGILISADNSLPKEVRD